MLQVTFENDDQFVASMREVFPSLAGWIGPEIATETACRPVDSDSFAISHFVSLRPLTCKPTPTSYSSMKHDSIAVDRFRESNAKRLCQLCGLLVHVLAQTVDRWGLQHRPPMQLFPGRVPKSLRVLDSEKLSKLTS